MIIIIRSSVIVSFFVSNCHPVDLECETNCENCICVRLCIYLKNEKSENLTGKLFVILFNRIMLILLDKYGIVCSRYYNCYSHLHHSKLNFLFFGIHVDTCAMYYFATGSIRRNVFVPFHIKHFEKFQT